MSAITMPQLHRQQPISDSGPADDREFLMFLMAYLRSGLARYYLFHTSSSWGVSRQQIHVEEMLDLPFPIPGSSAAGKECRKIVREVARIVTAATQSACKQWADRERIVRDTDAAMEPLVDRYFDILPIEKVLIRDTVDVIIPSARPTQKRPVVPTIVESDENLRNAYTKRLCETLDRWARRSGFAVKGNHAVSSQLGIGVTVLQRSERSTRLAPPDIPPDLLATLDRLRKLTSRKLNTFELVRGIKAFDGDRLYVVKPLGQRHWTETAALNDADEIAGSILMQAPEGVA